MSSLFWLTMWGLAALVAAAAAGILAGIKNRDYSFWMGWSFILPPMVIVLALMPRLRGPRPRQATLDELDQQPD